MKHNFFKTIFNIYFTSKKILIINFIIFCLLFAIFSKFQIKQISDNQKTYKHTVKFYNIFLTGDGSEDWYFENLDIQIILIPLIPNEYQNQQIGLNFNHLVARQFSNDNKKSDKFYKNVEEFVNFNKKNVILNMQSEVDNMIKLNNTIYYDPLFIYKINKRIKILTKQNRHTYVVEKNLNFRKILGNSFILSFFIISLIRVIIVNLNKKKK